MTKREGSIDQRKGGWRARLQGKYLGTFPNATAAEKAIEAAQANAHLRSHLLIPDTQIRPGLDNLDHLWACVDFIVKRRPDVVVMIGDWWDFPSLSSWSSKKSIEGRRVVADIAAGNNAMRTFISQLEMKAPKNYWPEMHFTLGNHEQRLQRWIAANPQMEGVIGYKDLALDDWKVHDFTTPVTVDGVSYAHYFYNPYTGKPLGGTIHTKLKNLGFSFVQGHIQLLDYGRKYLNNGQLIQGLVCGAFYQHEEGYKGPQGNNHFRGLCYLHDVDNGAYDLEEVSMGRLLKGRF